MYTFQSNILRGLLLTVLIGLLMACGGGGGGGGSGSESVVARGVITAIGSIWVNGVEYETPAGGSYSDDDEPKASFTSDDIGKVVSLRGLINDDRVTGTADEVQYEAEIEGAADSLGKINGVTIMITSNTNVSKATLIGGELVDTQRYEVSGQWFGISTIIASFIKNDDDDDLEDEVKGYVEFVDPGVSLTVHGVVYSYSGPTIVAVDDYVEVHFNGSIANEVELEDDYFDDLPEGQEIEVEGPVTMILNGCPDGAEFKIVPTSTCVKSDPSAEWSDGLTGLGDLSEGLRVEAEGHMSGGLLIADEIKGRGNEVRILAIPTYTVGTSFTFFSDTITVNTSDATDLDGITLVNLMNGSLKTGVEVRGIRTDDGTGNPEVFATSIRPEDADQRNEVRGAINLDGANDTAMTIKVLGITKNVVEGTTQLRIEDLPYTGGNAASFLVMIDDNDIPSDGPNDIIDLRFDVGSLNADQVEIEHEDD